MDEDIGPWKALIDLVKKGPDISDDVIASVSAAGMPYSFLVRTRSNIKLDVAVTQSSLGVGSSIHVEASIKEYDMPVDDRYNMRAVIEGPKGLIETSTLSFDGNGRYRATIENVVQPGTYTIRILGRGTTLKGNLVERDIK